MVRAAFLGNTDRPVPITRRYDPENVVRGNSDIAKWCSAGSFTGSAGSCKGPHVTRLLGRSEPPIRGRLM